MNKKGQEQRPRAADKDDVRQANEEGDPREQGRTRGVPVENYGKHKQSAKRDSDAPESGRHDAVE